MASRIPSQSRSSNSLFAAYDAQTRQKSSSPAHHNPRTNGYSLHPKKSDDAPPRTTSAFGAYPGTNPYSHTGSSPYGDESMKGGVGVNGVNGGGYRVASPNKRGQYSDAVLSELESQNEDELQGMTAKVRMLKDLTTAIGTEIRDSTALADTMNLNFENTSARLKGTMNRMLRMAQKTGVGWKAWFGFFAAVCLLFWYVWLF